LAGTGLLWTFVSSSALLLYDLEARESERMRVLMEQYRDTPMDLTDASLVAIVEQLNQTRIFTLDHHLRVYRLNGQTPFDLVPA
jgi:predicted nucleic acid-binding protein